MYPSICWLYCSALYGHVWRPGANLSWPELRAGWHPGQITSLLQCRQRQTLQQTYGQWKVHMIYKSDKTWNLRSSASSKYVSAVRSAYYECIGDYRLIQKLRVKVTPSSHKSYELFHSFIFCCFDGSLAVCWAVMKSDKPYGPQRVRFSTIYSFSWKEDEPV